MSVLTAGKQKDSEYSAEKTDLQTSDLEPVCDLLLHKERFAPYVHNYGSYGQYIEDFVNYLKNGQFILDEESRPTENLIIRYKLRFSEIKFKFLDNSSLISQIWLLDLVINSLYCKLISGIFCSNSIIELSWIMERLNKISAFSFPCKDFTNCSCNSGIRAPSRIIDTAYTTNLKNIMFLRWITNLSSIYNPFIVLLIVNLAGIVIVVNNSVVLSYSME